MNTIIPSLFNSIVHPKALKHNPKFFYCRCQASWDKRDTTWSVSTEGDSGTEAPDICEKCGRISSKELERKLEHFKISWKDFQDDGVFMEPQNSNFLFKTSFSMLGGALFAFLMKCYVLASLDFVVFLTSINHWRKPRLTSRRRTMDLCAVFGGLLTHLTWALFSCKNLPLYSFLLATVGVLYVSGRIRGNRGDHTCGAKLHGSVHAWGTITNCVLYTLI